MIQSLLKVNAGMKLPAENRELLETASPSILKKVLETAPGLVSYAAGLMKQQLGGKLPVEADLIEKTADEIVPFSIRADEAWGLRQEPLRMTDAPLEFTYAIRDEDGKIICSFTSTKEDLFLEEDYSAFLIDNFHNWLRTRNMIITEGSKVFATNKEGAIIYNANHEPKPIAATDLQKAINDEKTGFAAYLKATKALKLQAREVPFPAQVKAPETAPTAAVQVELASPQRKARKSSVKKKKVVEPSAETPATETTGKKQGR